MARSTDAEVREKLATRGVESLTDAELLSIIIREGNAGASALDVAEGILESYDGSLTYLARAPMAKLRMTEGIGMKRAAVLSAAFELSSRLHTREAAMPSVIRTKDDVTAIMRPIMSRLPHEEMWVLYLTSANGVIDKAKASQGGVAAMVIDYRLIVKRAIELLSSAIILVHNHPSGMAAPSDEDMEITNRLNAAAALFDIKLIDHIIVAGDTAYSFRQNALIK